MISIFYCQPIKQQIMLVSPSSPLSWNLLEAGVRRPFRPLIKDIGQLQGQCLGIPPPDTTRHLFQQLYSRLSVEGDCLAVGQAACIKHLVHHAVIIMCTVLSWSCLLSFLCNPYKPFLIHENFILLVSFHFFYCF